MWKSLKENENTVFLKVVTSQVRDFIQSLWNVLFEIVLFEMLFEIAGKKTKFCKDYKTCVKV